MSQSYFSFTNIVTSTGGNNIKTGPGVFHVININSAAAGLVAIYDGTSSSTSNSIIATLNVNTPLRYQMYNVGFKNGLYLGVSTTTAELTVSWA